MIRLRKNSVEKKFETRKFTEEEIDSINPWLDAIGKDGKTSLPHVEGYVTLGKYIVVTVAYLDYMKK